MNFSQALIVPALTSTGLGALLLARNLSMVEVGVAAPRVPPPPAAIGTKVAIQAGSAEFSSAKAKISGFRAITLGELGSKAVEVSGRVDPFVSLMPPSATEIIPPESAKQSIKLPPGLIKAVAPPVPVPTVRPVLDPYAVPTPQLTKTPIPFAGDKPPGESEPQWLVRGVMSTGSERICMLEGRDESITARVGDRLEDGSRVESISSRGVTFIRNQRRYVKLIGGIL